MKQIQVLLNSRNFCQWRKHNFPISSEEITTFPIASESCANTMSCLVLLPKCTQKILYFELWSPPRPILCSKPLSGDAGQLLWAASLLSCMTMDGLSLASLPAHGAGKYGPWKRRCSKCILHVQDFQYGGLTAGTLPDCQSRSPFVLLLLSQECIKVP